MNSKKVLVIGKFMPPHEGHKLLIEFAKNYGEVFVIVDHIKDETLSTSIRTTILKEDISNIHVIPLSNYMPQSPDCDKQNEWKEIYKKLNYKNFWDMWCQEILKHTYQYLKMEYQNDNIKNYFDYIIASEKYGIELANHLSYFHKKANFVLFDYNRKNIHISATQIRNKPKKYFNFLLPTAKRIYQRKICLIGAESTWKSSLSLKLAKILKTKIVYEYAEEYLKFFEKLTINDFYEFLNNQLYQERIFSKIGNYFLLCDSNFLSTKVFAENYIQNYGFLDVENKINDFNHYYNHFIDEYNNELKYDFYILIEPDEEIPFNMDKHRGDLINNIENRKKIHNQFLIELNNIKANYVVIKQSELCVNKKEIISNINKDKKYSIKWNQETLKEIIKKIKENEYK